MSEEANNCPRCRGFMLTEEDRYGKTFSCFACGYVLEPEVISQAELDEERVIQGQKSRWRQPSHGKLRL